MLEIGRGSFARLAYTAGTIATKGAREREGQGEGWGGAGHSRQILFKNRMACLSFHNALISL